MGNRGKKSIKKLYFCGEIDLNLYVMCLFFPVEKTSEKDIICYKVLRVSLSSGNKYVLDTPFYYSDIPSQCYESDEYRIPFSAQGEKSVDELKVEEGFIHSYKTIEDARKLVSFFKSLSPIKFYEDFIIVECCIPKGVKYYEGECNSERNKTVGYASENLWLLEMIEYDEDFFSDSEYKRPEKDFFKRMTIDDCKKIMNA